MKNFLSVRDVSDVHALVQKALELKADPLKHSFRGSGKSICLIFFNSSLRTRLSTQKAAFNLGLDVSIFNVGEDGWQLEMEDGTVMNGSKAEHVKEAAAVIGQYHDVIGIRCFAGLKDKKLDYSEHVLNAFVNYSGKPILNLESATLHPCQSLTDLITIEEYKKTAKPKIVLSWAPHPRVLPQAVPSSFAEWVIAAGYDLTIAQPQGYELENKFTNGATIEYDQQKALEGADFVYVKNWSSMQNYGQNDFQDTSWMIDQAKMNLTRQARFMHCLPVRRNVVVADEVIDSEASIVIPQAANRVWAVQAVLHELLTP